jgi:hypothetical protein
VTAFEKYTPGLQRFQPLVVNSCIWRFGSRRE